VQPKDHLPDQGSTIDRGDRLKAFLDLLELRFFSANPALATYKIDSGVVGDAVEYAFWQLPDEVVKNVVQLIGCEDTEVLKFYRDNVPCTGFRIKPSDEEMKLFDLGKPSTETGLEPKGGSDAAEGHPDDTPAERDEPQTA
jgi:hypothetical protein